MTHKNPISRPLTERQRAVLEFVREHVATQGCPPTAREICRHFGFQSPHAATGYLRALERKGHLTRQAGQARNLRLRLKTGGIPILGDVAAGRPILAIENAGETLDIPTVFGPGILFAVRVKGDSMRDAGILDGDTVVVRHQPTVPEGAIGVAILNGEATVKRIRRCRQGYRLDPENERFYPILVSAADARRSEFRLAGPVVGVVRKVAP
jgi:repressor LexA